MIGRKLIGKFPTITDDSKVARKINQVLEKEKNRLIHQYDKELADFKKEYKSQAAYDKENGYDFTWSYGDEVQCKVTANNEKYFCVMLSGYTYEGGAYGNYKPSGFESDGFFMPLSRT